ncbi:hypothetical protein LCAA2362_1800 [Lacticaseibacillus casei A2-362]|nr:hypothetical protein [Lacticaseibacillus paracasei]EKQ15506.1 hypothetical protein LCAA2362_1800 [Lacticaseibacillus casei A2-362]AKU58489.1 hypothetical protein LPL9_0435 [Lacticaseibacillus paracasei]EKQ13223.1 hypothetical protein LCAM36_1291 [Lacticaseibacillus paracasei]EKQ15679.1 hypothetical protein LCAT71499_2340 [Lacticaseibacillus paracasei]EKQ30289.1 hypothetical protein LCALPC37_0459 [Lacticaseibacillus paracasei]
MFIGSADHRVHTIDQSNDHAASSSSRTYAGARSISRKIGKLKAAPTFTGMSRLLVA